ncbi:alpha/beta fold hydrolase [Verticiella sediminum]|uniref:Alpha/beta fold hydrolase n=1 Tax=Verticiella sediminum TaxID=1247510 RepID=A0A556AWJ4_9BURK|nr:alpha/beta hydrolase [Verticiella sediminum]TSH97304.1 alpha/beta fold hydrolase [Verticiella sediminum]
MPYATATDGVRLFYESQGSGPAIVWVHEFAGDHRSWEPQLRHFAPHRRCVVFAARGYPPSDVPHELQAYSQAQAADDIVSVLDAAGIERAHIVGLSMGGFATLHVGLRHPARARSLVVAGVGYGAHPDEAAEFQALSVAAAQQFEALGSQAYAPTYAAGPARIPYQLKNPQGWAEFAARLGEHDATGAALTLRGVQARRPSLYALRDDLRGLQVPTLVVAGDQDDLTLPASLYLKATLPAAGLLVLPRTGHTINLEEPEAFNRAVADFIAAVEAQRWTPRDPRTRGPAMQVGEPQA